MPIIELELHPVDDIITNASGQPGARTFYLQAIKGDRFAREDIAKLYALFQDRLHLSGAASILWNWQPPGEQAAEQETETVDRQGQE